MKKIKTRKRRLSPDEEFIAKMDMAISFHRTNLNDPYSISNAVICALLETRNAYAESRGLPLAKR